MKVLFSNPPWWEGAVDDTRWRCGVRAGSRWPFTYTTRHNSPDRFKFGDYLPYPFFMGYAATYLQRATGADVHLRDSIALRESEDAYFRYMDDARYEYVFIESATPSWGHDRRIIETLHRRLPEMRIVVTGPIATNSDDVLSTAGVCACIRGEYEKGSVKVLNGARGLVDYDLLTKEEMNRAPFPWFDEVIAHRYWDPNPRGTIAPHAQVWSSRGCPYKCIFCVWPATMTGNDPDGESPRTVRHYTVEYMEAFLSELVGRFHYKSIYFDDDTFNLGNRHVVAMCEVMRKIGLPWSAMCRADTIQMETWKLMRESGCFGVKIGIESGNQFVVDKIVNKHLDLDVARQVILECKRLGMTVHGTFTYGLPGETREHMLDTKRFIASLPFDSIQESGTAEIEGTPLHTLRARGALNKYEGAHIDASYRREVDGSKKWQGLAEELQHS